jgi:hypothetical protein
MIARKRLPIIVIALCVWLPLQAIAGQWSHCVNMEAVLSDGKNTLDKTEPMPSHPCHQTSDIQTIADNIQTSNETSNTPCNHCQFVCHWHCVILLADLIPYKIEFSRHYSPYITPTPAQPVLPTPQRPPQQ